MTGFAVTSESVIREWFVLHPFLHPLRVENENNKKTFSSFHSFDHGEWYSSALGTSPPVTTNASTTTSDIENHARHVD